MQKLLKFFKYITTSFLILAAAFSFTSLFGATDSFAQSNNELNQAQTDRAVLEAELRALEREIAEKEQQLKGQQGQSATLSKEISQLKIKIDKSKLDIKAKTLTISKLSLEISDKSEKIGNLEEKIEREQESLAQLIRKTNDINQANAIHVLLSEESVSDFYSDLDSFSSIKRSIKHSLDTIRGIKNETEDQKTQLERKQDQELDAKAALEAAKKQVEKDQSARNKLLSISKDKEKEYQKILAERAQRAAEIRAKLFEFAGGTVAIPFGDALLFAEEASKSTGIRPALILAILTQESNLGANVGRCYLAVPETGAGINAKTSAAIANVMKPSRDVVPFMEITKELGIDPFKQVVSCPIAGGGYGGAMGPSQFIPSTWNMFKSRIAKAVGVSVPNPWKPGHAIMATAIYMYDLGASSQTYSAERNAACRYYSGRKCDTKRPANSFYGNSVMKLAENIQNDIEYLKQYGISRR
jgi:peptidoglycan hydrolase CwlO-like protein